MDSPDDTNASPKTPTKTEPLGELLEPWFEGPDVVTALRIYDGDREYPLPRKAAFTLGASRSCDIAIPGSGLSALHCGFVRKGTRLRLIDQDSTNGLYTNGRRVDALDLYPGDTFTAPPLTFIAMNDEMRVRRLVIADIVGNFTPTPDSILVSAVKTLPPLLLTGEPGCDLDRLARAIHAVSFRRSRALIEIVKKPASRGEQCEILTLATRATLVIDLYAIETPLDPTFCSMLFSPEYNIRVIVLAPTSAIAKKLLATEEMERLQHIWVRPLGMRPDDIPHLLAKILAEREATFRLADLTKPNYDALRDHDWRDNFTGLRSTVDRLIEISRVDGWEKLNWLERSAALKIPKTTLYEWFSGLGLSSPLFAAGSGHA